VKNSGKKEVRKEEFDLTASGEKEMIDINFGAYVNTRVSEVAMDCAFEGSNTKKGLFSSCAHVPSKGGTLSKPSD
jgi:hypothetical protein